VFSTRTPEDFARNRLTEALDRVRAAGREIVDLTESNPTRAGFEYPLDLLAPLAHPRGLAYAPHPFGSIDARRAVAFDYRRRGLEVAPERIVLTASTSEAYSLLFKLLADPGDDVLVPRPSYPLFDHLTRLDALRAQPYDLDYHGRWSIDLASIEGAIASRTRAVLIVNPNNPTGSFVQQPELDSLAELCAAGRRPDGERHPVAIVSDEVFADYELAPGAARLAGQVVERRDGLTFALGGLSKSVGLPQVKLAWIVVGGAGPLVERALQRLELVCDTYLSVSTPVQAAAAELLSRGAAVRTQIQARIAANYRRLSSFAAAAPACRVLHTEGGWYAVLQVPSLRPEEDLVVELLEHDGVLVHPGYFFDFPRESYLIVSLLVPERAFADAIARVLRHFDCTADLGGAGAPRRQR
jgi:alanine-synthesizing transaminase